MAHNGDSKLDYLHIRLDNGIGEIIKLILDNNKDVCKTELVHTFLMYGIVTAFSEDIHYDLKDWKEEWKGIYNKKNKIPGILNRIHFALSNYTEMKGG